jgi:ABC-type polysaccharide/polyol phosphate transport system ATPase subunit
MTTMSDVMVQATDLTKTYRLYQKPAHRILDLLGLLPRGRYREHVAIDHLTLTIRRGERVGIIGRNGAGKSTLLKLVTQVVEPTSGHLHVGGTAHALLSIGTGFHPDFTGRENVIGYLAQLGVTGARARKVGEAVVGFAELEEYIDQPVKTYSTGMQMRLMFAVSTAIEPDLLVVDEVLGVGDAYFAQKSFARMRQLCDEHGATMLLVTHDIYSAARICNRIIWIDRGRIVLDGEPMLSIQAYEDSIKQQEERRLRLRAQQGHAMGAAATMIEVYSRTRTPLAAPVFFSRIALVDATGLEHALPLERDPGAAGSTLQDEGSNWGGLIEHQGRVARSLRNYESPFQKVAGVVAYGGSLSGACVRVEYCSDPAAELAVRLFAGDRRYELGALPPGDGTWARHELPVVGSGAPDTLNVRSTTDDLAHAGSGTIQVTGIRFHDARGEERYVLDHGAPCTARVSFRVNKPHLREHAQVLLAIRRDGVHDVCRVIARDLLFDADAVPAGLIEVRWSRLPLAAGRYTVTVMIAERGYYDRPASTFYSINPGVYSCIADALEIQVASRDTVAQGTVFVDAVEWSLSPHVVETPL